MASLTLHPEDWKQAALTGPVPIRWCIENGEMCFCQMTITAYDIEGVDVKFWELLEEDR